MSEVTELKNCPFCGGEAKIVAPLGYGNVRAGECGNSDNCAATGPWSSNEAEAIAAWNTRAEANSAEPVAWMHHHPKVPDAAFKTPLPRGADELGWTETPLYAHPPAAPDTVTLDRALAALLAVVNATRAYLPPDGIDAQECLNRILDATDNPEINPIIAKAEGALK